MKFFMTPVEIASRRDISRSAKDVYSVILTYDKKYGCKLKNKDIALCLGIKPQTVSVIISKLVKLKLIIAPETRREQSSNRVLKIAARLLPSSIPEYDEHHNQ